MQVTLTGKDGKANPFDPSRSTEVEPPSHHGSKKADFFGTAFQDDIDDDDDDDKFGRQQRFILVQS